jgi:hypothetical protein
MRVSFVLFIVLCILSCVLSTQSQTDTDQEGANFDKNVAEALPGLVNQCKSAKPLSPLTVHGPRMVWSRDSDASGKPFYYRLDSGSMVDDRQVNIPRDKDKPMTLVLVVEELKGKKEGFYLNGSDAYSITFTTCVLDWPEKHIRGTARMTSSPPESLAGHQSTVGGVILYQSLSSIYHDKLVDWVYTWPSNTRPIQ